MSTHNAQNDSQSPAPASPEGSGPGVTYWRVEGSLVDLGTVRPVAYFTWNAQSFLQRWTRRGGMLLLGLIRIPLYATHRVFATRVLHTLVRGVTRDRLDLLGEEYFHYILKPRLRPEAVRLVKECQARGPVVLAGQGLEHVMLPLAQHLGVQRFVANRLEFRGGVATGRLLEPVIRPRGALALLTGRKADGSIPLERLARDLGLAEQPELLEAAALPAERPRPRSGRPLVLYGKAKRVAPLSIRDTLRGKHILLVGVTGFIGKVWLANLLNDLPEVGKIYLLIRRQRSAGAGRRFQKIVEESPAFDTLHARHGSALPKFLAERIEVVEGDVSRPGLGLDAETRARLASRLDLVVNSSGLTDFNPDLRDALASNVGAALHLLDFTCQSDHAGLIHLSTCYVAGARDGRVSEELRPNYTPVHAADFDAEQEWKHLEELARNIEERAESPEMGKVLQRLALRNRPGGGAAPEPGSESQIRRNRARWVRNRLTKAGTRRANRYGWPNTYTFTKSLAESLLATRGAVLPVAIVRPSIVETSTGEPFRGWNEGINTSAPLSYLLGTYFRQLPTNERKCLDVIPVDLVTRGMTLVAAAVVARCHHRLYQLATSASNPCDMGRSIELTGLAHRKHYRAQQGLEHWLRSRFDTIPVSKSRYRRLSIPAQKALVQSINRAASALPFKRPPLARQERDLIRAEKLIELYEPFILHNEHVFEAENIRMLSAALPEEEKTVFGYDDQAVDWWEYWINIHIPALRKWCYPLLEGRAPESRPRRTFSPEVSAGAAAERATVEAAAPQTKATWPSS